MIDQVVARYSNVWLETEWVVDILKKYWMQICLKNNWEIIDAKLKHKFYLMSVNKHVVINEIFDKLHDQKNILNSKFSFLCMFDICCMMNSV